MVETIMLVGEPSLNPKKPDEWIETISECVSRRKGLPAKLATGITVGCLQKISDRFEEIMLFSTVFDVSGSIKRGPKRKFRMRRTEHDGCIGCATVHVRLFSTSSDELLMDSGPGDTAICPFHPKSAHFGHLLTLNPTPSLSQIEAPETGDATTSNTTEAADGTTMESTTSEDLPPVRVEELYEEATNVPTTEARPISPLVEPADSDDDNNLEVDETEGHPSAAITGPSGDADIEGSDITHIDDISDSTEELETATSTTPTSSISEEQQQDAEVPRERKTYYSSFIPERDNLFYGRCEIFRELEEILLVPQNAPSPQTSLSGPRKPNLVCLRGLGGIGKTAVATEFVYRFMHKFNHVIWLNASSEANLGRYSHDSAVALGLVNGRVSQDHQASRLKLTDFLRNLCAPWLLILDNCEDGVDISHHLPNDSMCSVIATARKQPLTVPTTVWSVINVPGLTSEEAARFLVNCLDAEITDEDAEAICRAAVRYHISPLVCRQLTRWCARGSVSFKDITVLLEGTDTLARRFESPVHVITSSVLGQLNEPATALIRNLCFYDGTRVSKRLVRTAQSRNLKFKILSRNQPGSEKALSEAASRLVRLAMVDIDGPRDWSCPSIIQESVRGQLDDETWRDGFNEACSSIWYHWPSSRKLKNIMGGFWEDFDQLHSHVHHLASCLVLDRLDDKATSYDPGEEFTRLLVYHTWYNSRRGNQSEDRNLHDLAQFLMTTTRRQRSKNSRRAVPRRWLQVMDDDGFTARLVNTRGLHDSPYIAVSYQWGAPQHLSSTTFKERGFDLSILPQQISDAISFTRNVGCKYLWIDSICIDQNNPTEVSEELAHMTEYYSNSSMIFCALGKDLGRSRRSRLKWKPGQRLDISSYSILRSSPGESSPWTRAWLLQELSLAQTPTAGSDNKPCSHDAVTPPQTARYTKTLGISMPRPRISLKVKLSTPSPSQKPQAYKVWKRGPTQLAKAIIGCIFLVPTLSTQMYTTLVKGTQAIVEYGQERPQLRYYIVSFLLFILSVCIGNCMPRFLV